MNTCLLMAFRLLVFLVTLWGVGLLWYQVPQAWLRIGLLILWLSCAWVGFRGLNSGYFNKGVGLYALCLVALLLFWFALKPTHQRLWADDVAELLDARINGDQITLFNVRDFEWRTEADYTARWTTQEYDLSQIESADLILSYWMGPAIAHTLISFGFADGQRLVFSLEIRKERGEQFSALGGFFKQFEAVMIAATEADIVRTRTHARGEDVFLYRLNVPKQDLQLLFKEYVATAVEIKRRPQYYNTLTSNCTTIVYDLAKKIVPLPLDYRLLLSGYFAEYAYDLNGLMPGFDYQTLHDLGHVNQRAGLSGSASGLSYSEAIRQGVPVAQGE